MMRACYWIIGVCCMLARPVGAQLPLPITPGGQGVTVAVMGEAKAPADIIRFEIVLTEQGETYMEAWEAVQKDYGQVWQILQEQKIPEESITVEGPVFLSPQQFPFGMMGAPQANMLLQPEAQAAPEGGEAPHSIQAKVTLTVQFPFDPQNAREMLARAEGFQGVIEQRGFKATGPTFALKDLSSLERAAIERALSQARVVAQAVAAGSRKRLAEIQSVMVLDFENMMKGMMQSMMGGGILGQLMGAMFGTGGEVQPFAVKLTRLVTVTFGWE